jgi:hypothetical protein
MYWKAQPGFVHYEKSFYQVKNVKDNPDNNNPEKK